ncbi:ABC-three component system middle component 1 [Rossellomorea yichunensis]|uniref:ABC-three component system middle component 1 n=1 Tax=Rossellomorea yichunensis TaxID=3077331 RepID=UPI0028DF7C97|nr:ABC-three component system middle component 1 [Rossellomorea sp. YC4-1]MDT9025097.1 hypothetical protein [Rossellomorea sp. YC4-1]
MIEIFKKLFHEANYNIEEIQPEFEDKIDHGSFFAKVSKQDRFDFFLVMEFKEVKIEESILQKVVDKYFEYIVETNSEQGIDKNLSLMILLQEDTVQLENKLNTFVYDLEEDPYDFKKYVLSYTKEQFALVEHRIKNEVNYTHVFQQVIQNKEIFSAFKNSNNNEARLIYDLISKCFIKLHFLTMQVDTLNLSNLENEIINELAPNEQDIRDKIISFESKDEINLDRLLEKLEVVKKGE